MVVMSQALFDEADHLEEDGNLDQAICRWREVSAGCAKELGFTKEAEEAFIITSYTLR